MRTAVDLVNTFDVAAGSEKLANPADLAVFIESHDGDLARFAGTPSDDDLVQVRALRHRLRQVFEAPDEKGAALVLNEVLSYVNAVPRLSVHGEGPHLHFEAEGESLPRYLGAVTAMGLTVALIEGGFERFGICASASCDDVYVDTSRNRSRRHCSDTCTTRENVAAHRARRRASG